MLCRQSIISSQIQRVREPRGESWERVAIPSVSFLLPVGEKLSLNKIRLTGAAEREEQKV